MSMTHQAVVTASNGEVKLIESFDQMNLREPLLRGIHGCGFERPSAIQQRVIMPCIMGHSTIFRDSAGVGKTAGVVISILQRVDVDLKECQALILTPTREVAKRTQETILALGQYLGVTCHACVGGTLVRDDIKCLEAGAQIVVGTPGRVHDMVDRTALRVEHIKMFVLDEADDIISRGFNDQIHDLFTKLPHNIQTIVSTSTYRSDLQEVTAALMKDPIIMLNQENSVTLEGILQFYIAVEREELKSEVLLDLCEMFASTQMGIFCNTRLSVETLFEKLRARGASVCAMYIEMSQQECDMITREFRSGSKRILITTDFFARDINGQASLLINYDLPNEWQNYVKRIGRSGKFGRKGVAINIVTADERQQLRDMEEMHNIQIPEMPANIDDLL